MPVSWKTLPEGTCQTYCQRGRPSTAQLVTMFVLVVMHLKTRRIEIAGITAHPHGEWVKQVARSLTDPEDGFLRNATRILIDRDTKFLPLRDFLENCSHVKPVVLPPRSPNCNAHLERFMRSLKSECLDRMIFFGAGSLRTALREFAAHYHGERNHQGLGNRLIDPGEEVGAVSGRICSRDRLGGLLRYYHRKAA